MASAGGARGIDALSYAVAGNILAATGSCLVQAAFTITVPNTNPSVGGMNQNFQLNRINSSTVALMGDGTNGATKSGLTFTKDVSAKIGCTWGAAGMTITSAGLSPATGLFDGDMTNSDTAFGIADLMGAIAAQCTKNVVIYNIQLSDAQLQALTT